MYMSIPNSITIPSPHPFPDWGQLCVAIHCSGFSCCRAWALGMWAYLPLGIWALPGPGIESMFPVLVGRFLNHWMTRELPI